MEMTTTVLLLAIVVVGAGMQRITGLGFALVASPFVVLLIGAVDGVILVNLCGVAVSLVLSVRSFPYIDWRKYLILVSCAIIGILPGALIVKNVPNSWLDILVGVLILVGLSSAVLVKARIAAHHRAPLAIAGVVSGAMNVTAGVGGPPLGIYGVLSGWEQKSFAATMQPTFFTIGSMSLIAKLSLSVTSPPPFSGLIWTALVVACLAGMGIGELLVNRVTPRASRMLLIGLASLGAATVLVRGVFALAGA
jgi:uncharacterized membrane protein YfcA